MTFREALQALGIEDYGDRILNSNSHGEMFHCMDYFQMAENVGDDADVFREWFVQVVEMAEEKWKRPESVFQHIPRLLAESLKESPDDRN